MKTIFLYSLIGLYLWAISTASPTPNTLNDCTLKGSNGCKKAKIFFGFVDFSTNIVSASSNIQVLRGSKQFHEMVANFVSDCTAWKFDEVNITFADEDGIWSWCKDLQKCHDIIATPSFPHSHTYNHVPNDNYESKLADEFISYFSDSFDNSTLNIAYIFTDQYYGWESSDFLTYLVTKQSQIASFIHDTSIYTKFILFSSGTDLTRYEADAISAASSKKEIHTTRLSEVHQNAQYYFQEVLFFVGEEKKINMFDLQFLYPDKTFSTCKELAAKTYEYPCQNVGIQTKNEPSLCDPTSLMIILMLERIKMNEEKMEQLKDFLTKLTEDCVTGSRNRIVLTAVSRHGKRIVCSNGEECGHEIEQLNLDDATFELNLSKPVQRWNMQIGSLKLRTAADLYGFLTFSKYKTKAIYFVSNIDCTKDDIMSSVYSTYMREVKKISETLKHGFIETYNYGLALLLAQFDIIGRFVMLDQPENGTCFDPNFPMEEISNGFLKTIELNTTQNFNEAVDQLKICASHQIKTIQIDATDFIKQKSITLLVVVISILVVVGLIFIYRNRPYIRTLLIYDESNSCDEDLVPMISMSNDLLPRLENLLNEEGINVLNFPDHDQVYHFDMQHLRYIKTISVDTRHVVKHFYHRNSKFNMALKYIRIPQTRFNEAQYENKIRRLIAEIKNFRIISDFPNVVDFYGVGFFEGELLICMELMDLSLKDLYLVVHRKMKKRFSEDLVGYIAVAVIDALKSCQSKAILHRDIKPANILLHRSGRIKLCDFGASRILEDSLASSRVGTFAYWPPEHFCEARTKYDARSDLWSLGITLLEVLLGCLPYIETQELSSDPTNEVYTYVREKILAINFYDFVNEHLKADYSGDLCIFLKRCLEKFEKRSQIEELEKEYFYQWYKMTTSQENLAQILASYMTNQ